VLIVFEIKFSHVQHLVSEVSGVLRPGKTRFDAFRSIFPAGQFSRSALENLEFPLNM
jgi:anthranilate/para-aminobenzoate synthase component I